MAAYLRLLHAVPAPGVGPLYAPSGKRWPDFLRWHLAARLDSLPLADRDCDQLWKSLDHGLHGLDPQLKPRMLHHDLGCFDSTLVKRYPLSNDKHYLDVAAAQRYCGITLTAWADVAAVVRLLPGGDTAWWQLLDESETARTLTEAYSADTDLGFQTDWLGLSGNAPASPRWLTPSLPGWLLCHRPDQPLPNAWIDEVTDVLRCNDRTTSDHYREQRGRS